MQDRHVPFNSHLMICNILIAVFRCFPRMHATVCHGASLLRAECTVTAGFRRGSREEVTRRAQGLTTVHVAGFEPVFPFGFGSAYSVARMC